MTDPHQVSRRHLLVGLGGIALTSCGKGQAPPAPAVTAVPLDRLEPGRRVRVEVRGRPVELLRDASGTVTGRSLLCTHQGCEVAWVPERSAYVCPCHEGRFDAEGRPTEGPPPSPLAAVRVEVRDGKAVLGG